MTEKELLGNQIKTDIKMFESEWNDLEEEVRRVFEKVLKYLELN